MELGDAIYSLLSFAIENGIDPKEVLKSAIEKYENRMIKKGHIGCQKLLFFALLTACFSLYK